jgi:hypothetical protein
MLRTMFLWNPFALTTTTLGDTMMDAVADRGAQLRQPRERDAPW